MHHPTRQGVTYYGLCHTSRGALAGTKHYSVGSLCRIDLTTHRTISEHSTTELHLALATTTAATTIITTVFASTTSAA